MADKKILRKIAVILVTDVVGFSKMMEANEDKLSRAFVPAKKFSISFLKSMAGEYLTQPVTQYLLSFKVQFLQWFVQPSFKS